MVISEGLCISIGVTTRLPRGATDEVLKYKDWVIPFGVSSDICFLEPSAKDVLGSSQPKHVFQPHKPPNLP